VSEPVSNGTVTRWHEAPTSRGCVSTVDVVEGDKKARKEGTMSAQQGTIVGRGTRIPTWPVLAALVGVLAFSIGALLPREGTTQLVPIDRVTSLQVRENSSAAVREQGTLAVLNPADFAGTGLAARERHEALGKLDTSYAQNAADFAGNGTAARERYDTIGKLDANAPIKIGDFDCHQCL
jgi:hypothetical protein